jgi:DNA sulfur modification protein DndB
MLCYTSNEYGMTNSFTYTFPALRGQQAQQTYYVAMCPIGLLPKIFLFNDVELPAELRAQRTLNSARIPEMARYIVNNPTSYAFSAITASVDGIAEFQPMGEGRGVEDLGLLVIPMSAKFILNDGQHRRAAIEQALQENPAIANETIAVVFYLDVGLKRTQQLFADLNQHAVKPTKSISILYDFRDPLSVLVKKIAATTQPFHGLTEFERTTISNRSIKLFTLSSIYQAVEALLGRDKVAAPTEQDEALVKEFWELVTAQIPEWDLVSRREVSSAELRREFVHSHGVALHAIALAGRVLLAQHPNDWQTRLTNLRSIDWRRSNTAIWEGRSITNGHMSKAHSSVQRTALYLKRVLGLQLTKAEQKIEDEHD